MEKVVFSLMRIFLSILVFVVQKEWQWVQEDFEYLVDQVLDNVGGKGGSYDYNNIFLFVENVGVDEQEGEG